MRLIDADYLKILVENTFVKSDGFIQLIDETKTAYDIDKVVEELDCDRCESCSFLKVCEGSICCRECHKKTIEIVKHGGISDDVCEWEIDGVYLHSPHNRPFVTCIADDEDYRYNFCPVCGKKIKAVE